MVAVMWFRRDLRLADNPALLAALERGPVVPLFVVDPVLWERSGDVRRSYLLESLRALDASLGGALVVRRGDPVSVVPSVVEEAAAESVHIAADFGPYGSQRDWDVEAALAEHGVALERVGSSYAVPPGRVRRTEDAGYQVFSAFRRAWLAHGWPPPADAPEESSWHELRSDDWPDAPVLADFDLPAAGEEVALSSWRRFLDEAVESYSEQRDFPAVPATSGMSRHLKWGEVHPRTLLADLTSVGTESAAVVSSEICWREFFADVLWRNPDSARQDLKPEWASMEYDEPGEAFERWQAGRTGFPIVDAGMRELRATGLMHNRVRMIVASFLAKDLHIWWRHGADHFMEWLVDADLASNQQNWQWVAGSGTDAAPYFRIFNPVTQSKKFDPHGAYIRRWVPELADVPASQIHLPGAHGAYPQPMVDHAEERAEALRRYQELRDRRDAEGSPSES